jgi:hypothetical protein
MKIRMLSTAPGSIDGVRVASYEAGVEYDLTNTDGARALAQAFVGAELAKRVAAVDAPNPGEPDGGAAETDALGPETGDSAVPSKPGRKPKAQ